MHSHAWYYAINAEKYVYALLQYMLRVFKFWMNANDIQIRFYQPVWLKIAANGIRKIYQAEKPYLDCNEKK